VTLITHLHAVLTLGVLGCVPPLSHVIEWNRWRICLLRFKFISNLIL